VRSLDAHIEDEEGKAIPYCGIEKFGFISSPRSERMQLIR